MEHSPKDRVISQLNHRETDPIPYVIGFEGDVAERLDDHYGSDQWRGLIDNAVLHVPTPNMVIEDTGAARYTDPYGSVWRLDRRPYHLEEPVLETIPLEDFTFPELSAYFTPEWKREAQRFIEQHEDHFLVAGFGFGLFERTWVLRGFCRTMIDTAGAPQYYDDLVEQVTQHQIQIIERLLELPVDGIWFSDDWGYQQGVILGPERWRRVLKPRLARQYARVHQAGKYVLTHCCGSISDIIPDLIEIGLDVYESVQPEARNNSPYALKREYGNELAFWGGLGSQSTIPFGTPDEIKAEVTRLCREMGRGGGYILAPAKALQPETPTENAAAVVEAFLDQSGVLFP